MHASTATQTGQAPPPMKIDHSQELLARSRQSLAMGV